MNEIDKSNKQTRPPSGALYSVDISADYMCDDDDDDDNGIRPVVDNKIIKYHPRLPSRARRCINI